MQAPEIIADMRKANLDIDPLGGEELQKVIDEIASTPPILIELPVTIGAGQRT